MSIGFLFFVRDSLSFSIVVAIASSSRILFSNPFTPLLMTTGSRLKCPAVTLNGRLANSFPKYPTTALPNAPGRLRVLLSNKSSDMVRHQRVGVKQKTKGDFVFPQKAYISFIILRISKDLLTPIFPGNQMIKSAGILNPWFSCHVIANAEIEPHC